MGSLSRGGFNWLTEDEIIKLDVNKILEDNPNAFILEVDLEYPEKLHKLFKDSPSAPEKLKLKKVFNLIIVEKLQINTTF